MVIENDTSECGQREPKRLAQWVPNWVVYWCVLAIAGIAAWTAYPFTVTSSYFISCALLSAWSSRKGQAAAYQPLARKSDGIKWSDSRAAAIGLSTFNCLTTDVLLTLFVRQHTPPLLYSFGDEPRDGYATAVLRWGTVGEEGLWAQLRWWPAVVWAAWVYWSPMVLLLIHDTWFYATHRALHSSPRLYRWIHHLHHERTAPEAWDLFWMHPIECVVTVVIPFLVTPRLLPLHWIIWEGLVVKGILIDCYGHCGFDAQPFHPFKLTQFSIWPGFPWRRVFLTAKHHDLHHMYRVGNYGLYLDLWDRMLETETPSS